MEMALEYLWLKLLVALARARALLLPGRPTGGGDGRDDRGQATPEYALVILAAVALAATLIVWAKKSGAMAQLFSFVMAKVKEAAGK